MSNPLKSSPSPREEFKVLGKNHAPLRREKSVREVVGVFRDPDNLQDAVAELRSHGFMQHEFSMLAGETIIQEKLGHLYRRIQYAEDDPRAPRTIFVRKKFINIAKGIAIWLPVFVVGIAASGIVFSSDGTMLEIVIYGIAAGAVGASIGLMLASFIARQRAEYLQNQIKRGGLLLWVQLRAPEMEKIAKTVMLKHAAQDVHVHEIAA
jgi:hypothetical protein